MPDILNITLISNGGNHRIRSAEIELYWPIPESVGSDQSKIMEWADSIVLMMSKEIKHNQFWRCYGCERPSREAGYNLRVWDKFQKLRLIYFIFHVCDTNVCGQSIQKVAESAIVSRGLTPYPRTRRLDGKLPSMAASCATCENDDTADVNLPRCSKCKTIRYCSAGCQRKDWTRHKESCAYVKAVRWVGWE